MTPTVHPTEDFDDIIGYDAAARLLGVAVGTVYAWVSQRRVPHFRISKRCVRFSRRELLRHLQARAVTVAE